MRAQWALKGRVVEREYKKPRIENQEKKKNKKKEAGKGQTSCR